VDTVGAGAVAGRFAEAAVAELAAALVQLVPS
jgi:hypothetical protein